MIFYLFLSSSEETNEVAEENEFHQAGVSRDLQCDNRGRRISGRPEQGTLEEGETNEISHQEVVQDTWLVLVRHSFRKEKLQLKNVIQ